MINKLSLRSAIAASFTLFLSSYLLCIAGDLLFGWTMYESWMPLFPGFVWPLTLGGFLIGLLWVVVYSVYVPAFFAAPYNFFLNRSATQ